MKLGNFKKCECCGQSTGEELKEVYSMSDNTPYLFGTESQAEAFAKRWIIPYIDKKTYIEVY